MIGVASSRSTILRFWALYSSSGATLSCSPSFLSQVAVQAAAMVVLAGSLGGCARSGDALAASAAQGSLPAGPAAPSQAQRQGRDSSEAPQRLDTYVRAQLGPDATEVVERASRVLVGRLRVVSAEEAESASLKSADRIAGYPVDGDLAVLPREEARPLAELLLDPAAYVSGFRRCRNAYLIGLRFILGGKAVEFALGMDCQQALWAFASDRGPKRLGYSLGHEATGRVLHAASSAGVATTR